MLIVELGGGVVRVTKFLLLRCSFKQFWSPPCPIGCLRDRVRLPARVPNAQDEVNGIVFGPLWSHCKCKARGSGHCVFLFSVAKSSPLALELGIWWFRLECFVAFYRVKKKKWSSVSSWDLESQGADGKLGEAIFGGLLNSLQFQLALPFLQSNVSWCWLRAATFGL